MRLSSYNLKKLGALSLSGIVLLIGFSTTKNLEGSMAAVQSGEGKMVVLYDGKNDGTISFGSQSWVPGESRSITVEIRNEGEIDFISSMNTGDYPSESMVNEFQTIITNETGDTVFQGIYSDVELKNIDVPVGHTEKFKVSVQWEPDEDKPKSGSGKLGWNVSSMQKI